jgi:hypothetical protein
MQLYLNAEEYEILKTVFYTHDWLCDCKKFPECQDFETYQKLSEKIDNLSRRETHNFVKRCEAHNKLCLELRQAKIDRGEDPGPLVYV